jgi:aspartate racemase
MNAESIKETEMKTIGLVGGLTWESTAEYYRIINERIRDELGGLHSAKMLLYSFDFAEMEPLPRTDRWDETARLLSAAAAGLERAGAELCAICANTMHKVADEVQAAVSIPLIHIADALGERIGAAGIGTVGLMGTAFTMEQEFYRARLEREFGVTVIVPNAREREAIHRVILDELAVGRIDDRSRDMFREIIARLVAEGAEGVVLGCTEIPLLIGPDDIETPLFDTMEIHAAKIVETALR